MKNNWLYIALIVGLASALLYFWDQPPKLLLPDEEAFDEAKLIPYAVIDQAHSRHFNEQGALSYEFSTRTLKHFRLDLSEISSGDFTTLDQPVLRLYAGEEVWFVSAGQGRVTEQGQVLKLAQSVRVWQEKTDDNILELNTTELLIYPNKKMIQTDQLVTIRSVRGAIEGRGMVVDLAEKKIQLKSKVRGTHEPI